MPLPEISVQELQRRLATESPVPQLIDVREPDEWEIARIEGARLLPLSQWPALAQATLTDPAEPLLILCHHGGIDAWSREIDPAVPRY